MIINLLIGLTVSTRELAILCGTLLGLEGIKVGSKISLSMKGMVIEPKSKA